MILNVDEQPGGANGEFGPGGRIGCLVCKAS